MNKRNAPNLVVIEQLDGPSRIDNLDTQSVLDIAGQMTKRRVAFEQWIDHEDRSPFDVFSSIDRYKDVIVAEGAALNARDAELDAKMENLSAGQTSIGQMRAEYAQQFSGDVVLADPPSDTQETVSALDAAFDSNNEIITQLNGERKNAALLLSLLRQHGNWLDKKLEEKAAKFNHDPNIELIEVDTVPLPFPTLEDDLDREPLILRTSEPLPHMYPPARPAVRADSAAKNTLAPAAEPSQPAAAKATAAETPKAAFAPVDRDILIQQELRAIRLKARSGEDINALSDKVYIEPIAETAKHINERLAAGVKDEDTLALIAHRRRMLAFAAEAKDKMTVDLKFSQKQIQRQLIDIEVDAAMANNATLVTDVIPRINQLRTEILTELERRQKEQSSSGKPADTKFLLETHWSLRSLANQLKDFVSNSHAKTLDLSHVVEKTAAPEHAAQDVTTETRSNLSTADVIELMTGETLDQDERDELTPFTPRWAEETVSSARHLVSNRTDIGMLEAIYKISLTDPRQAIREEIVRQRRADIPLESYRHLLAAEKQLTTCINQADERLSSAAQAATASAQETATVSAPEAGKSWLSRAATWATGVLGRARNAVGQLVETLTPRPQMALAAAATFATAVAVGSISTSFNEKSGVIAKADKASEAKIAVIKIDPAKEAFTKASLKLAAPDTLVMHGDVTVAEAKAIIAQEPAFQVRPQAARKTTTEHAAAHKVFQTATAKAAATDDNAEPATKERSYASACNFAYSTEGEDRVNQCLKLALK